MRYYAWVLKFPYGSGDLPQTCAEWETYRADRHNHFKSPTDLVTQDTVLILIQGHIPTKARILYDPAVEGLEYLASTGSFFWRLAFDPDGSGCWRATGIGPKLTSG